MFSDDLAFPGCAAAFAQGGRGIWGQVKSRTRTLLSRSEKSGADGDDGGDGSEPSFLSLSYLDSLLAYFAHRKVDLTKSLLMGVSGEAFKFFYDRARPARSIWVFLNNPLRAACSSLGYRHTIAFHETIEEAMDALQAQHDKGEPAILQLGNEYPLVHPGLRIETVGGETALSAAELKERWTASEGFLELGLYGYYLFTVEERDREPKPHELYLGAFRRAMKIARAERRVRGCFIGLQAFEGMSNVLRAKREPSRVTRNELIRVAEWNTLPSALLIEGRRAAVRFLEGAFDVFDDEDQQKALTNAVKQYRRVIKYLEQVRERHPTTDPEVGSDYVLPLDRETLTTRDYRRFFAACRKASRSLDKASDAEYKAVVEVRRVINISEKSAM